MIQYCFVVFVFVVAVVFFWGGEGGGANRFTQQGHER